MPSYSGVWTLTAQLQAIAGQNWPMGPGAPTSVSATAGDATATVSFTAPTFTGVPPGITGYLATSSPGGVTATGASSPLTVTGLTNGTAYTFGVQATNGVQYGPAGTSGSVTPQAPRGVFFGGNAGGYTNVMQYITISTTGNATDFGDLIVKTAFGAGCASSTRGLFGGGRADPGFAYVNTIQYITILTTGNATDFGDLTQSRETRNSSCSSSTRGVWGGGYGDIGLSNVIDYVTIATTGNATDFGDLTVATYGSGSCSSPVRGLFAGGGGPDTNVISYITIASAGNATDFGDLTQKRQSTGGCSSSTRGVFGGGYGSALSPVVTNTIDYVTIASTGNATYFGDLTVSRYGDAGCSSNTIGVFGGGYTGSAGSNVIDYVTIGTTGNATDFGDLLGTSEGIAACSNGHGGLQ